MITEAIAEYLKNAIRNATTDDTWCRTKMDDLQDAWISDVIILFENATGDLIAYGKDAADREILESPTDYVNFSLGDHQQVLEQIKRLHRSNGETLHDIPFEEEDQW